MVETIKFWECNIFTCINKAEVDTETEKMVSICHLFFYRIEYCVTSHLLFAQRQDQPVNNSAVINYSGSIYFGCNKILNKL